MSTKKPIRVTFNLKEQTGGGYQVLLSVQKNMNIELHSLLNSMPTIPLSRTGDACYYSPLEFYKHNDHAPFFNQRWEMQFYINRIAQAFLRNWEKVEKEVA